MKGTNAAQRRGAVSDLDSLNQHLAPRLLSPTAFEIAPSRHFRVTGQVPVWYTALNAEVLDEILTELNQRQPQGRLNLRCVNGLPNAQPLRGGPSFSCERYLFGNELIDLSIDLLDTQ